MVISIAKSLPQKENNLATVTLLKSRIGKDGIVFQNCKFDNELLQFNTDTQNTLLGHEEERVEANKQHANEVYKDSLKTKEKIKKEVLEESRFKLESAVSKSLDEKEETLNQLNNLEDSEKIETKKIEVEYSVIEDIEKTSIIVDDTKPIEPEKTIIPTVKNRAAEVYIKTKQSKKNLNTG